MLLAAVSEPPPVVSGGVAKAYLCPKMLDHGLSRCFQRLDKMPGLSEHLAPSKVVVRWKLYSQHLDCLGEL